MKTRPMKHQVEGCKRMATRNYFAMGAEQGTGKTWMLLADAEARFTAGSIRAVLVVAPNGVHVNWILREIPTHLEVPHISTYWLSGASKKHTASLQKQLTFARSGGKDAERFLFIHAMNVDALNTKTGYKHAEEFINSFPPGTVDFIVDESHVIKNPGAKRTQKIIALGHLCKIKRISSGTLVANSPLDLFSQYEFLAPGLLGTRSYRAFVSEYAELLPVSSALVQDIIARTGARGAPQIVAKNPDGTPRFRNMDKLTKLMAPHTFRVTKEECLDLPAKIYQTQFFDLDSTQLSAYNQVVKQRSWLRDDGEIDTFTALTVVTKLRQITSGFMLVDGEPTALTHSAPRLAALQEIVEGCPDQMVVWASFREELAQVAALLSRYGEVRQYHGGTKMRDRTAAIDDFQAGRARFFVSQQEAGGTGLTLTAASVVVYYSNDFSLVHRTQSEDRCHRKGTTHHVVYIDLVARETIDEKIASALQSKKLTAATIMSGL